MFQTVIVVILIILSIAYLTRQAMMSMRRKNKGHCSSCGKE